MSEEVITQVENSILTVTLNRPQARNAINRAASEKIGAAMVELDKNPEADFVHLDAMETYVSQNWDSKIDKPGDTTVNSAMKEFSNEGKVQVKQKRYSVIWE